MKSEIVEPLTGKKTTRWMELKRLAKVVIEYDCVASVAEHNL